jgi:restriction endonuclease S subunit
MLNSSYSNKCFIIDYLELENVWNPEYYKSIYLENRIRLRNSRYGVTKLGKVCSKITKGETPLWRGDSYQKQGILFVKSENVLENELFIENTNFIEEEVHLRMKRSQLKKGDVLFNIVGASIGRACVFNLDCEANINQAIALIRFSKEYDYLPEWLSILLNSSPYRIWINQLKSGGARDNIDLNQINDFEIPKHPLEVQKEVIRVFQSGFLLKKEKEKELTELQKSIDDFILAELNLVLPKENKKKTVKIYTIPFNEISGLRFDPLYFINKGVIKSKMYDNIPLRKTVFINKGQSITKDSVSFGNYPVIAGGQSSPYSHSEYNFNGNIITVSASGAYAGYVWYHDYPIFASDCIVLQSKDENEVSTLFVYYVLKALQREIYKLQQGAGQPHVYARDLEKFTIPVPPLQKQNEMLKHINKLKEQIQILQMEANSALENAKQEVEKIILE